jgi:hypothetical protein
MISHIFCLCISFNSILIIALMNYKILLRVLDLQDGPGKSRIQGNSLDSRPDPTRETISPRFFKFSSEILLIFFPFQHNFRENIFNNKNYFLN